MRKTTMLRKTLTILSLIGLLLSVGLWGASYYGAVGYITRDGEIAFVVDGMISHPHSEGPLPGFYGDKVGFFIFEQRVPATSDIDFPMWFPTLLFGSVVGYHLFPFHRRRKRKKLGLCLKCGYDLRASKERCPECGEEFGSTGVAR